MTVEEIRAAYYTKPFQPFLVRLNDGRKYRVPERHHIGISPLGDEVTIAQKNDIFVKIDLSKITSIEPLKVKRSHR